VTAPAPRLIVTIDGPAGTGKSSVGRALAGRLGVEFLDTGAMYRAATAIALKQGVDLRDGAAIAALVRDAEIEFDWAEDPPALLAWGRPMTAELRTPEVDAAISPVSALPQVRTALVEMQRRIAADHPRLVSEGRDQGSVVFPDADAKIFLDATLEERARRRAEQMNQRGEADVAQVAEELAQRDEADSSRLVGPLVQPDDAAVVDTTALNFDEVIDELERIVRRRTGDAGVGAAAGSADRGGA